MEHALWTFAVLLMSRCHSGGCSNKSCQQLSSLSEKLENAFFGLIDLQDAKKSTLWWKQVNEYVDSLKVSQQYSRLNDGNSSVRYQRYTAAVKELQNITVELDHQEMQIKNESEKGFHRLKTLSQSQMTQHREDSESQEDTVVSGLSAMRNLENTCLTEGLQSIILDVLRDETMIAQQTNRLINQRRNNLQQERNKYTEIIRILEDTDKCASSPCLYGQCINRLNRYECHCSWGFSGRNCELACGNGWTAFNQSCYKVYNNRQYWTDAKQECELQHSYLIEIESLNENNFTRSLMLAEGAEYAWIGLSRLTTSSPFLWSNLGQSPSYLAWIPKQPDNGEKEEDCVQILRLTSASDCRAHNIPLSECERCITNVLVWSDIRCGNSASYICEKSLSAE